MALTGRGTETPVWPWDEQPGRRTTRYRSGTGIAWPVPAATVAVLAGGYGWLGAVIADTTGAVIGGLLGLLVNGLLLLLVGRVTSGPRTSRAMTSRAPASRAPMSGRPASCSVPTDRPSSPHD
ncbi:MULTISPECIES: hypothetical protein [unclassified Streptomyces]|uniref:hypothetical protein n=1 Tax=unclassified Streptomyces TaxID=2593676 RepID=UPI00324DBF34